MGFLPIFLKSHRNSRKQQFESMWYQLVFMIFVLTNKVKKCVKKFSVFNTDTYIFFYKKINFAKIMYLSHRIMIQHLLFLTFVRFCRGWCVFCSIQPYFNFEGLLNRRQYKQTTCTACFPYFM